MELISIIVPIYNVEKYIEKCIKSILNQTYEDFELLLINDGSTDDSLKICEQYSSDKRVHIFSKENGGLSDARNYGIERISGEYVTFIDSDDYISPNYLFNLYNSLKNNESDIAITNFSVVDEDGKLLNKGIENNSFQEQFSSLEIFKIIMYQKGIDTSAWGKLYKSELFTKYSIYYPKGLYFEDLATTYKLIFKSRKISFINCNDYYYVYRIGSITKSSNLQKKLEIFDIIDEIKNYLRVNKLNNKTLQKAVVYRETRCALDLLKIYNNKNDDRLIKKELKYIITRNFWITIFDREVTLKNKLKIILARFCTSIYIELSKKK